MHAMTFDDQVAIVTGAGGGLGRCHALELARRGARVVVNDLGSSVDGSGSSISAAQAVVDEITAAGGTAIANGDSVATEEGGAAIVATAMEAFGQVDVLVNNAGILRDAAFKNMTADQVDAVMAVHLSGAFNVTRAVWPVMRAQKYGRIVQTNLGHWAFRQFRPGQLRRRQDGSGGHDARPCHRRRPQWHCRQRHRAHRADTNDRGHHGRSRQSHAARASSRPLWSICVIGHVTALPSGCCRCRRSPIGIAHSSRRRGAQEVVSRTADLQEGLASFAERRTPKFLGR